jgi:hypothetical protein
MLLFMVEFSLSKTLTLFKGLVRKRKGTALEPFPLMR